MGLDDIVSRGIAAVALWSSRHARAVVSVVLLLTLVAGYGVTTIDTNVDVADVLPRGDPNTAAAQNLTKDFRSTFTQQVTFQLHADESGEAWARDRAMLDEARAVPAAQQCQARAPAGQGPGYEVCPDPLNITDEVYVRATAEMVDFIQGQTDFERAISISNIYALINWTVAGGQDGATEADFALPGYHTEAQVQRYELVDSAVKTAILDTVDAIASPSWNHAAALFMPAADNERDMRELGAEIMEARDRYVAAVDAGETEFTVFGSDNPPLLTVDLPVANAHSSALVEKDMFLLMPIIAGFIVFFLFIAFRNVRAIAISFAALGIGVTWTYGTMGYMGIALNTLNMTIVPLIMGVGIDYAIHMINEFIEHKSHGATDDEAFQEAGRRAGLAMFIATLTTVLGLVVMMVSPSLLMAQLGFLSAVAIAAIYVITLTFIPAALTLLGGSDKMGASFAPSRSMPAMARGVSKMRWLALPVVALLSFGAFVSSGALEPEAFGDPGRTYPKDHWFWEDDPVRQEHEQGLRYFYEMEEPDVKANILTFEGPGILTPEALRYYDTLERNLAAQDLVIADTLRTVPFFLDTWLTVKGGGPCALAALGASSSPSGGGALAPVLDPLANEGAPCADQTQRPKTEAGIVDEIEQMFDSPMRELASIIVNHPSLDMAAMTFSVRAGTFEEAEEVWDQVHAAIAQTDRSFGGGPPEGIHVAFVGNTATNFLFQDQQLPWLTYMSVAATIILFILVLLFTRDLKATLVATTLAGITSLWWLGMLPFLGIGLAITLMLPLVFIFNIGTDYAVHIIWNMKQVGNAREVFATTGKAILFSALTTAAAFAVFVFIRNEPVSRTMVATTLSILVIFVATLLFIPIFYPVREDHVEDGAPTNDGTPTKNGTPTEDGNAPARAVDPVRRTTAVPAVKRPKA